MYLTGPVYGEEKDVLTGSGKREEKDVGQVFRLEGRESMDRTGSGQREEKDE